MRWSTRRDTPRHFVDHAALGDVDLNPHRTAPFLLVGTTSMPNGVVMMQARRWYGGWLLSDGAANVSRKVRLDFPLAPRTTRPQTPAGFSGHAIELKAPLARVHSRHHAAVAHVRYSALSSLDTSDELVAHSASDAARSSRVAPDGGPCRRRSTRPFAAPSAVAMRARPPRRGPSSNRRPSSINFRSSPGVPREACTSLAHPVGTHIELRNANPTSS
jgi:hypothetical protein